MSPALAGGFFTTSATWEAQCDLTSVCDSSSAQMKLLKFLLVISVQRKGSWRLLLGVCGHRRAEEKKTIGVLTVMSLLEIGELSWESTEKAVAPRSSTLAWKITWMEEPGRLQSMWLLRVRHDWATSLPLFTFMHWRRKWQPTPVFLPGEPQGRGNLVGCRLWGHSVGHDWSDLAAAAAAAAAWKSKRW